MRCCHLLLFILSIVFFSCNKNNDNATIVLSEVSSMMEQNHEMAYNLLDSLDQTDLTRHQFAKYCLLKSMALDKMYVDLTTDSLIGPAVKYYSRHGKADDRLKSIFYSARILENSGKKDYALEQLLKGEPIISKCEDHLFVGRYYVKLGDLYASRFEWEKALESTLNAVVHCEAVADYRGLATAHLTASSYYGALEQIELAMASLGRIREIWDNINDYRKGEYYRLLLTFAIETDSSLADSIYTESLSSGISPSYLPYLAYVDYFISKRDGKNASDNLTMALSYGKLKAHTKEYENRCYKIYALSEDYKSAYESMAVYYSMLETYEHEVLTSEAKILEEKIDRAREEIKNKYRFVLSSLFAIMMVSTLVLLLLRTRNQKRELAQTLFEVEEEKNNLEEILKNGTIVSSEMMEMISSRIKVLNDILIGKMSRNNILASPKNQIHVMVNDRDGFLLGLVVQFSISHPKFIRYLKDCDLTDWEIGFCCLFILGLSGKEISGYILSSSNVYNISSRVRHKLGLTQHDTNLSSHLKLLLDKN